MGMMIDGRWVAEEDIPRDKEGRFVRLEAAFHHRVGEPARYHLYVSLACP